MADRLAILQVSTTDAGGGASRVAWELFQAYRRRGHPAWLAVGRNRTGAPGVLTIPNEAHRTAWSRGLRRISQRLRRAESMPGLARRVSRALTLAGEPARELRRALGREDFDFPGSRHVLSLAPRPPDVLHVHNLHGGYFDLRALPELSAQVPTVLTLHDAWLLSGHCAHSLACERWKTGCGACPDLSLYPSISRDSTASNWRRKRDIYRRSRLHVATPSRWLMARVEQSNLAPSVCEARVIRNGVDLVRFHPGDRREARDALGLPHEAHILLATGTAVSRNVWKDFSLLTDAVRIVASDSRVTRLIVIVLGEVAPEQQLGAALVRFVPYETDRATIARYYQAADVYVHAARVDTFPSAVLEALACGTPVVATAVGGIPEQIVDGRTGFLVPEADPQGLAARITGILTDPAVGRHLSAEAANDARRRFDLEEQVDAYLKWYASLAGRNTGHQPETP